MRLNLIYLKGFLLPFPERQIKDSSKLKKFADDNFESDENGIKFCKMLENTVGKGEIARYEQFLLFQPGLVWERVKDIFCFHCIQKVYDTDRSQVLSNGKI